MKYKVVNIKKFWPSACYANKDDQHYIKVKSMKLNIAPAENFRKLEIVKADSIPLGYRSVLVFIKKDSEWLMVKNKYRGWEFPGGHKENDETVFETATREAFEEAGADIKNLQYVGFYRLTSGHTTSIISAEIERLHDIPTGFETIERKFVSEFPKELSFNDAVYPWLVQNL